MKSIKPTSKSNENRNKNVRLVKIDTDNFDAMTHLSVDDTQKGFLVENIYSLAEAYATLAEGRFVQCFGIYDKEIPVGFLMIGYDYTSCCRGEVPDFIRNSYNIWRLMIDKNFQNRGYGREAVRLALEYIRTFPCGKAEYCWLSYEPENETAKQLYRSFGFEERPEWYLEGCEMPAVLKL